MTTKLIRIGNSRGLRIPKAILEQCGFEDEVELTVRKNALLVRRRRTREGWEEQCRRVSLAGEDQLLDRENWPASRWDRTEWEW